MPVMVASGKEIMSLWRFFFGELGSQLLLLSLAQNSQCNFRAVREGLKKLSQLTRLNENLVVQHFQDVILLNPSSSGGAVRLDVINNQPEAFSQPELFTHDRWHLRCLQPKVCHRNLGPFLVMTRRTRRLWWLRRSRRCLRKSCQRQQRDDCNGEYGFHFHGFVFCSLVLTRAPDFARNRNRLIGFLSMSMSKSFH